MRFLRIGAFLALGASLGLSLFADKPSRWDEEAVGRKARYIYLESASQAALGNRDAEFELQNRAHETDTSLHDLLGTLGYYYLRLAGNNESMTTKGIDMIENKFNIDPNDETNGLLYAALALNMKDTVEGLRVLSVLDSLRPNRAETALMRVDVLMRTGDSTNLDLAKQRIDKLEVAFGKNSDFTSRKSSIYLAQGDTAAAIATVHDLLEYSPLDASNYVDAANFYLLINKPDSAQACLDKACDIDPSDGRVLYTRAYFYYMQNDTARYARDIDRVLVETDLEIEAKYDILLDYTREYINDSVQTQHLDSLFTRVLERHPQEPTLRSLYSSFLSTLENYSRAAEEAEFALNLDPSDPKNWTLAIYLYEELGQFNKAMELTERALGYHPDNIDINKAKAFIYFSEDRLEESIEQYKVVNSLSADEEIEDRAQVLTMIADMYNSLENPDSAYVYYEQAVTLTPEEILIKNNYAYCISEDPKADDELLKKAERMSASTIHEEPLNYMYLDTYAWILFKQQDYKRAKDYIDRAIEQLDIAEKELIAMLGDEYTENVNNAEYYEHAGDIYYWNRLPNEAVELWQRAFKLNPDNELLARKVKYKTYFHE